MNKKAIASKLLLEGLFQVLHRHKIYIEPLIADYTEHNNKAKLCSEIRKRFEQAGLEAKVDYMPDGTFYIIYRPLPYSLETIQLIIKLINFEKG